ncbi:MAG: hypothetical protein AB7N76_26270 [Planctomycetota bacterium]
MLPPAQDLRRYLLLEGAFLVAAVATVLGSGRVDALDLGVLLLPAHLHRVVAARGRGLLIAPPSLLPAGLEAGALALLMAERYDLGALLAFLLAGLYTAHPGDPTDEAPEPPRTLLPFPTGRWRDLLFLALGGYGALALGSLERLVTTTLASLAFLVVAFEALDPGRNLSFRATLRRLAACGALFLSSALRPELQAPALGALLLTLGVAAVRRRSHSRVVAEGD